MPAPIAVAAIAAAVILCVAAAGHYAYNRWIRPIYFSDTELDKYRRSPIASSPHEQTEETSNVAETQGSNINHSSRDSNHSENRPLLIAEPTTSVDFGGFFRGQYNPGTLLNPIVTRIRNYMNRREPEEQPAALPPRTPTDARRITVQSTIDGNHNNNDDPIYSSDTSSFSSDHSLAGSSPAGAQSIFNVSEGMEIINSGIISIEELNEERLQRAIEESVLLDSIEQQLADRRRSLLMQSLQTEAISSDAIIDNANTPHTHASNDDGEGEELESAFEGAFFNNEHPSSSSSSADEVVVDSISVIEEQAESAGVASDDSWSDLDG